MAGGGDEFSVAESWERGQGTLKQTESRAGRNDGRRRFDGQTERREDIGRPVPCSEIDEAGVGGIGVLGNAWRSKMMQHVLGQTYPRRAGNVRPVCEQLVHGVDAQRLCSGPAKSLLGWKKCVGFLF